MPETIRENIKKTAVFIFVEFSSVYSILVNQQTNGQSVMQTKIKIENTSQSVRETANEPFGFQVKQPPITVRMRL